MFPCILAVDDEKDILLLLDQVLSREGFRVITARNISEFWARNAEERVDLYLVDLSLPDGSGFNLVREIRRQSSKGVIILTGRGSETDHVVGLEIGADDYVTKPFHSRQLVARVNAVLRRTGAEQVSLFPVKPEGNERVVEFEFDGYRLSVSARQLWTAEGLEIELTTSEFELLTALVRRRGQVLSRDQIMNAIKGRDWESYDRVVDGIVSRLRRKIPVNQRKSHYIRTVHGVGYSFSV